jgi:hypothetical protein
MSSTPKAYRRRIVLLPVDGRPVVRSQVVALAATAGWTLVVPPLALLGHFREPAPREALADWLLREAEEADALVVSVDMLVYGGLVPSRFIADDEASLIARLDVLRRLRARYAEMPIAAFAATMRISNNNVNEEEKPYWDTHGAAIWQWSYWSDAAACAESDASVGDVLRREMAARAVAARDAVPEDIRNDYCATRARNLAVTEACMQLVVDGVVSRLILPQDDTAPHGFNIAERRALEAKVAALGLRDAVAIYAGADEVAATLVARSVDAFARAPGSTSGAPLMVYVDESDPANIGALTARYEDRPIRASIQAQWLAAGAELVNDADQADLVCAVWTRGRVQGDWAMGIPLPEALPDLNWPRRMAAHAAAGRAVAFADLAYANGGDPALFEVMPPLLATTEWAAYSGWNTASNTLGSLAAQCVLARHGPEGYQSRANKAVLALRLAEDFLYQAQWRQHIRAQRDERSLTADALLAHVRAAVEQPINAWLADAGLRYRVREIGLPWQRTFEIDLQLEAI